MVSKFTPAELAELEIPYVEPEPEKELVDYTERNQEIRQLRAQGWSARALGRKFRISHQRVCEICEERSRKCPR